MSRNSAATSQRYPSRGYPVTFLLIFLAFSLPVLTRGTQTPTHVSSAYSLYRWTPTRTRPTLQAHNDAIIQVFDRATILPGVSADTSRILSTDTGPRLPETDRGTRADEVRREPGARRLADQLAIVGEVVPGTPNTQPNRSPSRHYRTEGNTSDHPRSASPYASHP